MNEKKKHQNKKLYEVACHAYESNEYQMEQNGKKRFFSSVSKAKIREQKRNHKKYFNLTFIWADFPFRTQITIII